MMNANTMNKTTRIEITSRGKVSTKNTFCQGFRFSQIVSLYIFLKNFLVLIKPLPVSTLKNEKSLMPLTPFDGI